MDYTEAVNQASKLSKEDSPYEYHVILWGDYGSAVIQRILDDVFEETYHKGLIELIESLEGLTEDERFNVLCDGEILSDYAVTADDIDEILKIPL